MCQHNKAKVVASSRHDKVGDIECLVPDPSGGNKPSGDKRANMMKEKMKVRKWRQEYLREK